MITLKTLWKALRPAPVKTAPPRMASLFATPFLPSAGWWRDDATEQLKHYQSWVYAAVNAVAQEVARQKPTVMQSTGQADHEQYPLPQNHPLCRLLENPNPWLTAWELWYLTVVYLELTGNCFWYIAKGSGDSPGELWVVPTPWVKIVADAAEFIAGYEVTAPGGQKTTFAPNEIIHLKYPNPLDPQYGLSPLQANAMSVDANAELLKARYQTFLSGQRPGIVLQSPQMLNDQTVKRLEEKLTSKFAGRDNWQRPLVLEQGLAVTPWTLKPAEMDFLNSCKLSRDEIFALFRVPPAAAGVMENAGLGAEIWNGARAMFCEGTVQPKLELIGQCLTRDLGRRYGEGVLISFPDCSPRATELAREQEERDIRLGIRTINEVRAARGLVPYQDPAYDAPLSEER